MSRILKFRVWDGEKMHTNENHPARDGYSYDAYDEFLEGFGHIQIGLEIVSASQDHILMQFTGLLDRTGKEIYESDVVRFHPAHDDKATIETYVTFDPVTASFGLYKGEDPIEAAGLWTIYGDNPERYEVIGNLHEHPELLKHDQ